MARGPSRAAPVADVVIVGGGFVGMVAAAALARRGRRVVVLEARTGDNPHFRGEVIHPYGVGVLAELGLYEPLTRRGGVPVAGFAVVPGGSAPAIVLPYPGVARSPGRGLAMDHRAMVACLRDEAAARPGVELRLGRRVSGFARSRGRVVGVELDDGERIAAELTVVADGRHSRLRRRLGIAAAARLLSFTAVLLLDVEIPCAQCGHVFIAASGPILAYPVGGGRTRICADLPVSAETRPRAIAKLLRDAYAPALPEPLRSALLRAADQDGLEICANHAIRAPRCTAPGVALVGDAGGCWHPLTATGLTSGLNDVRVLDAELARVPCVDTALWRYQRIRSRFVRIRDIFASTLYEVLRGAEGGERVIRSGLMRYLRGSARARAASLALLSGQESAFAAFVLEYASVLAQAASCALHGELDGPAWGGRATSLWRLLRASCAQVKRNIVPVLRDAAG